jgi:hypothetical protein
VIGLLLLVLAGLAGAAWWYLLQGRERARIAAALTCREHGLLLMDDTVVLDSVELNRKGGLPGYGLRYRFDFAYEGKLHRGGSVLVAPRRRTTVVIATRSGQVIQEF